LEEVEREQEARDRADRERTISPLVRAADARAIDCDDLTAAGVVAEMKRFIDDRFPLT
ncbi:MAG TPA: (d)CMP kinase, partial [Polyangia bacterium]|nr:(d)CMP kinase [Polyangia bacterium]